MNRVFPLAVIASLALGALAAVVGAVDLIVHAGDERALHHLDATLAEAWRPVIEARNGKGCAQMAPDAPPFCVPEQAASR